MAKLDDQLREVAEMDKAGLRDRWASLTGRPVPRVSTAMLRLAVGYELQARALGGLSRKARRQLDGAGETKAVTRDIRPGMRLTREHGGIMHVVTIGDGGQILWNDREWRSLSEVARAITGTRWSGPAFFGLRRAA
ncbi:MAG: DUF2924 domain-containing protein [Novosphingobium sp.]|nr:DUF2924 domain-containing protein [Novosphingobium sp.]MCP5400932.1 DUF2924 domain-containing protein [Novosphingobium sp.]